MKRVLSIDGGGIRGIIPATVCAWMEEGSGTPINQLFDLVAGTSTGGILALAMAQPPHGITASELVSFYRDSGKTIFSNPRGKLMQLFGPRYSNASLIAAAKEMFGMSKLADAITEVLVVTYDAQLRRPVYLRRSEAKQRSEANFAMKDIAVATSSAPTYFAPYKLGSHYMIDGGVVANNPACAAYAHAKQLWPDEEILMVSLGTGSSVEPLPNEIVKWGPLKWMGPLIECLFDGTSLAVEDFFRHSRLPNYERFQTTLNDATASLDGTVSHSINALEKIGSDLTIAREGDLMRLLDRLKRVGIVLSSRIEDPANGALVPPGKLEISGSIENYDDDRLYLFTGELGRFWPSARLRPDGGRFKEYVHTGYGAVDATITLARVDEQLQRYIEYYRSSAEKMDHCGLEMISFKSYLDRVNVRLDHRKP